MPHLLKYSIKSFITVVKKLGSYQLMFKVVWYGPFICYL